MHIVHDICLTIMNNTWKKQENAKLKIQSFKVSFTLHARRSRRRRVRENVCNLFTAHALSLTPWGLKVELSWAEKSWKLKLIILPKIIADSLSLTCCNKLKLQRNKLSQLCYNCNHLTSDDVTVITTISANFEQHCMHKSTSAAVWFAQCQCIQNAAQLSACSLCMQYKTQLNEWMTRDLLDAWTHGDCCACVHVCTFRGLSDTAHWTLIWGIPKWNVK